MYRDPILGGGDKVGVTPQAWAKLGFRVGDKGTHTSRTIMLNEISILLNAMPPDARRAD